jgi:hypothetical protein
MVIDTLFKPKCSRLFTTLAGARTSKTVTAEEISEEHNRDHLRVIMHDVGKSIYHASSSQAILTGLLEGMCQILNINVLKLTILSLQYARLGARYKIPRYILDIVRRNRVGKK